MESTIRIQGETAGAPKGGLVGALAGGTDAGTTSIIEVDLRDASIGDAIMVLPEIAQAYRRSFLGDLAAPAPGSVTIEPGAITINQTADPETGGFGFDADGDPDGLPAESVPFPEAGDPHPFAPEPRTTDDENDLHALPLGSIALDRDFDGYVKAPGGWERGGSFFHARRITNEYGPAMIVYVPPGAPSGIVIQADPETDPAATAERIAHSLNQKGPIL